MKLERRIVMLAALGALVPHVAHPGEPSGPAPSQAPSVVEDTLRLDLATAFHMTLHDNFNVQAADARLDRARGSRLAVSETVLPSVSPALRYAKHRDLLQNTEGRFLDVDKQSARSGASLLLAWRPSDIVFRRAAAGADVRAAEASGVASRRDALWETARRYVALASAEESVENAQRLLAALTEVEEQTTARVKLGLSSELDRLRLENQVERQRESLIRARVEREAATGQLDLALGQSPARPLKTGGLPAADASPATLAGAVAEALSRRSDLVAARAAASSARHLRTSWSYGRLLPDLGAEVSPGFLGPTFGDPQRTFDANVYLSWTIGPGGLIDPGRLRTAGSDVDLADIHVRETEARITAEVREAYAAAMMADDLEVAAGHAADAAERVLRLTRDRDQRGLTAPYEVIQATDAWLRSSRDLIQAQAEAALARIRFKLVMERGEE